LPAICKAPLCRLSCLFLSLTPPAPPHTLFIYAHHTPPRLCYPSLLSKGYVTQHLSSTAAGHTNPKTIAWLAQINSHTRVDLRAKQRRYPYAHLRYRDPVSITTSAHTIFVGGSRLSATGRHSRPPRFQSRSTDKPTWRRPASFFSYLLFHFHLVWSYGSRISPTVPNDPLPPANSEFTLTAHGITLVFTASCT
jgi:hypothetical protein